jgi:hypothetical protein
MPVLARAGVNCSSWEVEERAKERFADATSESHLASFCFAIHDSR